MHHGSFTRFSGRGGTSSKPEEVNGLTIAFICGRVESERLDKNSNANTALAKIRERYGAENIKALTIFLYDVTGEPLSVDRVGRRYDNALTRWRSDFFEDPCYPHCHSDATYTWRKNIDKDVIRDECLQIRRFLFDNRDVFVAIERLRLVCCHDINIPDDLRFLFSTSVKLSRVEKVDEQGKGAVYDWSECDGFHGYTPWQFVLS